MLKRLLQLGLALITISLITLGLGFIYALNVERACLMLEGAKFRSFREVGVPFASPPMDWMNPTVYFDEGRANYMVSDMVMSGPYTCQAGQISADLSSYKQVDGYLDPDTGMLVWAGDQHEMIQENGFRRRISVLFWRTYEKISRLLFGAGASIPHYR
jgi:hypothetical protein